jgi:hypothetical protein
LPLGDERWGKSEQKNGKQYAGNHNMRPSFFGLLKAFNAYKSIKN